MPLRPIPCRLRFLLLAGLVLLPSRLAAEGPIGTHVVREGQTLRGIAGYYLGDQRLWQEIWKLNESQISDPDLIRPGQVLKIQVPSALPLRAAQVVKKSRVVEQRRNPLEFRGAEVNDLLQPLDTLRTGDASSSELKFGDATSLVLTEQTQVILGEAPRARTAVDREKIEIEFGRADLISEASDDRAMRVDVEIVLGSTVVAPRPASAEQRVRTRTRKPAKDQDDALLMVYEGESDVEAAGQRVEVTEGMGTTVAAGGPPSPPEKLLEAPSMVRPEPGWSRNDPEPDFEWRPLTGAASYSVEICRDPKCSELVAVTTGLTTTSWRAPRPLAPASYYWRVTARSASGLDGFPAAETPFTVAAQAVASDSTPPRATVRFAGPRLRVGERLVIGIGGAIAAEVTDDDSGLAEWTRLVDGVAVGEDGWKSGAWESGPHTAGVRAADREGNVLNLEPEPFFYDPDPPVISWGVEDGGESGTASGPSDSQLDPLVERRGLGTWARTTGKDLSPLVWTSSQVKWLPMKFGDWKIASDLPYIIVRARKRSVALEPIGHTVTKSRGLWIHATDAGCGVERLRYQLFVGPQKQNVLVIEAFDALDNSTRIVWTLE